MILHIAQSLALATCGMIATIIVMGVFGGAIAVFVWVTER
jgi:hypothetical protein